MPTIAYVAADLVAILVLAVGLYFRRHHRHDLMLSYIGVNIGVMGVTMALERGASAGLGFGLFGILSIIRLRSLELTQEEVAYYFVALATGLLAGLRLEPAWLGLALIALLIAVFAVIDHPAVSDRNRRQSMVLGVALTDEDAARTHLATALDADVTKVRIRRVDLVKETTVVDVCFRPRRPSDHRAGDPAAAATVTPHGSGR